MTSKEKRTRTSISSESFTTAVRGPDDFQVNEERRANRHSRPPPTEKSAERDWLNEARNGGWDAGDGSSGLSRPAAVCAPPSAALGAARALADARYQGDAGVKTHTPCGIESWVPLTNVRTVGKNAAENDAEAGEAEGSGRGDFGRDGLEYARPALTRARARDGLRNEGGHGNGGLLDHRGIAGRWMFAAETAIIFGISV
ncbi:hypothetical protein CISG_04557 [Coccidioides immitis RMSCC 3703]|uniref:Uncharacterized protein n=1 Tax=Coccidioides immitis RMSCC 3703 TaxID=454286 RepID=A0A0J8QPX0_COCIT|nr:hypothetical protein CISG_04557 [Coccidioides immitis RMSCC 3703]